MRSNRRRHTLRLIAILGLGLTALGLFVCSAVKRHQNTLLLAAAIHKAELTGKTDENQVLRLLAGGADPNALLKAPSLTLSEMLRLAFHLKTPAAPGDTMPGATILFVAAGYCDERILESLLKAGGDPNAPHDDVSVLTFAVRCDRPGNVALLVQYGADVNCSGQICNPLEEAALLDRRLPVLRFLLAHGADPNVRATDGRTPLMSASYSPATIRVLLQSCAKIDLQDSDGNTALMSACWVDDMDGVTELLQAGANTTLCDKTGKTPEARATILDQPQMASLIRQYRLHNPGR